METACDWDDLTLHAPCLHLSRGDIEDRDQPRGGLRPHLDLLQRRGLRLREVRGMHRTAGGVQGVRDEGSGHISGLKHQSGLSRGGWNESFPGQVGRGDLVDFLRVPDSSFSHGIAGDKTIIGGRSLPTGCREDQNLTLGASRSRRFVSMVQNHASPWATRRIASRVPAGAFFRRSFSHGRSLKSRSS